MRRSNPMLAHARRYPQPGELLLGKYRVESLIGEGGMGAVIRARHLELDEDVAIKCLLPEMMERTDIVRRFLREAKAAVKLKGEHVARVHDVGRFDDDIPYIVMEYLEGSDLGAIIEHYGAQDPRMAVDLVLEACEALAEAHSLGIIHRDVKASNFFITQQPNQPPVLKVLDFGIATAPEGTSDLTSTQSVLGTPAYMAPEQMRAGRTPDARSDIWSLGVVLYELLEGARPFRSEIYSELCLAVGMDPPTPMVSPAVPEALRAIVMRCLEKPLDKRYQSVAELAFDLMPFASEPMAARLAVEQCARWLGRRASTTPMLPHGHGPLTPGQLTPAYTPSSLEPQRLTSGPQEAVVVAPTSQTDLPGVRTPTSVKVSAGEVQAPPSKKAHRRGLVIGMTLVTTLALGGAGIYLATRADGAAPAASVQPAVSPPAASTVAPAPAAATVDRTDPPKPSAPAASDEPVPPRFPLLDVDLDKPPPEVAATPTPTPVAPARVQPQAVRVQPQQPPPPPQQPPKPPPAAPTDDDIYARRR